MLSGFGVGEVALPECGVAWARPLRPHGVYESGGRRDVWMRCGRWRRRFRGRLAPEHLSTSGRERQRGGRGCFGPSVWPRHRPERLVQLDQLAGREQQTAVAEGGFRLSQHEVRAGARTPISASTPCFSFIAYCKYWFALLHWSIRYKVDGSTVQ